MKKTLSRYWLRALASGVIFTTPFKAVAQSLPNPIFPREPELPIPTLPVPQPNPLEPAAPLPQQSTPIGESQQTITVERFEFEANTAFSDRELASVTQQFTGRPITFAELLAAEAAVTQKYVDAGYINSGAVILANQTFPKDRAVVKIRIIEGGLEQIRVTGTRRLNRGYVVQRLEIATQRPLNRDRLLEALQLLQLDPRIASIRAELQPGVRPEASILEVQIKEADTFNAEAFFDNERSPSVGSFRRGVTITDLNLAGLGDAIAFSYANTNGSHAYDLDYTIPFNPRNGTIGLTGSYSDTSVLEPPFDRIDIEGKSFSGGLTIRQPIILRPSEEFALGLIADYQQSQTFIQDKGFPLALGSDEQGRTQIYGLRFFQDYVRRNPRDVFAVRSQLSIGLDVLNATINDSGPDGRFFAWRGQAQYVRLLAPDTLFIFRTDAQLTPNPLVSLEQIGIGGARSVRGYRQDTLLTDNGILVSAEARLPIFRVRKVGGVLQVTPFVDFGYGWNNKEQPEIQDSNTLLGIGLGVLWQMGDNFSARIDYGIPLIDVDSGDRTLQEKGVYFSLRYSPF